MRLAKVFTHGNSIPWSSSHHFQQAQGFFIRNPAFELIRTRLLVVPPPIDRIGAGAPMTTPDLYRTRAADCDARAKREIDPLAKAEWSRMADSYRKLAEDAERAAKTSGATDIRFRLKADMELYVNSGSKFTNQQLAG